MHTVSLAIPDIFKPLQRKLIPASEIPSLTSLCKFISRAKRKQHVANNTIDLYFYLFNIKPKQLSSLPIASLAYLADCHQQPVGWVIRADPVHLHVDRDHLILADNHVFNIKDDEADALIQLINETYDDLPWNLVKGNASRWYINFKNDPQIKTHMLDDVIGKSISSYLISGEKKSEWQSLMNELQMLMHNHSINHNRNASGLLPINSVWFWGEGTLTTLERFKGFTCWDAIYTNESISRGLAMYTEHKHNPVPAGFDELKKAGLPNDSALIILDELHTYVKYNEVVSWQQHIQRIDTDWIAPLLESLSAGEIQRLELIDGAGRCYVLNRKLLHHWWKRSRPLHQCI